MTPEGLLIETMFRIADKKGVDLDFSLNPVQRKLDADLTGRDIIPKARQMGVSSYILARYTAACISKRNVRAVVISHEIDSTQRMLNKVHYYIKNLRGGVQASVDHMSKNEITFPRMDSMFYIGTAGSRKFGRGDTITHLHCSEYAYWPNSKILFAGLLQAVPASGEIAIESTGNGVGNDYHRRCVRAGEGQSQFHLHFFNWTYDPEYLISLTDDEKAALLDNLSEELEEPALLEHLTLEQIAWRRAKLEELDYDLQGFKQEYPLTLDECFQASGNSVFHHVIFAETTAWRKIDSNLYVLDGHPTSGRRYAIGCDVSGGVGRDNSVIQVVDIDSLEQVAEWVSGKIAPDLLGREKLPDIAKLFNNAYVTVENNNYGVVTIAELLKSYDYGMIYDKDKTSSKRESPQLMSTGFRTTARTKPLMIGRLRSMLANGLVIHSSLLRNELSTFIEHEDGKLSAQDGCYDDRVMAMASLVMGIEEADLYTSHQSFDFGWARSSPKYKDPFLLDNIIEELEGRRGRFPIPPQTIGGH